MSYNRSIGDFNKDLIVNNYDLNVLLYNWNYGVYDLNNLLDISKLTKMEKPTVIT